jgi:hypothetical protein
VGRAEMIRPNITFCETFAPVFKITLIRVLSATTLNLESILILCNWVDFVTGDLAVLILFALLDKAGPEDLCVRR